MTASLDTAIPLENDNKRPLCGIDSKSPFPSHSTAAPFPHPEGLSRVCYDSRGKDECHFYVRGETVNYCSYKIPVQGQRQLS